MNINYQVWHYPRGTAGSENIAGAISLMEKEGINTEADVFNFKVINKNKIFTDKLAYGDYAKIMIGYDGDLKTVGWGKIEEEEYGLSDQANYKLIKGAGPARIYQDYLVNQTIKEGETYVVTPYTFTTNDINSRNVFKLIVESFINRKLPVNEKIKWDTYVDSESGCEPWTSQVGLKFFKVWANKPVVDVLNQLRANSLTGNGDYDFWIDGELEAHFEPINAIAYPKKLTEGIDIISYRISRDIKPNFTAVRIFLGNDQLNKPVTIEAVNSATKAKYGLKYEYFNWGNYYNNVLAQYPESGGGTSPEVNYLRTITVKAAQSDADFFVTNEGVPKWKGSVTIKGNNEYRITSGTRITLDLPSISADLINADFILKNVKNDITSNKWVTTLDVEQKLTGEY